VEAVAYSPSAPWDRRSSYGSAAVRDEDGQVVPFAIDNVEPDYLATLGIPIVRGRSFAGADATGSRDVVIVSASTARRLWPGRDPIGRTLLVGPDAGATTTWRVVGVAADAHTVFGPRPPRLLYRPAAPSPPHMLGLMVRSRRPFASLARDIDSVLEALDPEVTMRVAPLEANLGDYRYLSVMVSGLAVSLGALALVLAAVGIYGVVAHVVAHRQREIGIRLALGGKSRVVLGAIVRRTLRPVLAGTLIGALGAVAVSIVLGRAVAGVRPVDPLAVGAAAAVLLGVALLASVVPARRGLRADPIRTLQSE
jgi:putative ABC transport system permease protein